VRTAAVALFVGRATSVQCRPCTTSWRTQRESVGAGRPDARAACGASVTGEATATKLDSCCAAFNAMAQPACSQ